MTVLRKHLHTWILAVALVVPAQAQTVDFPAHLLHLGIRPLCGNPPFELHTTAAVILRVTLLYPQDASDPKVPVLGQQNGDEKEYSVAARLDEICRGEFPYKPGSTLRFRIKNAPFTMDDDYSGEHYQVALSPLKGRDYSIIGIFPDPQFTLAFHAVVGEIRDEPNRDSAVVPLTKDPKIFTTLRVEEVVNATGPFTEGAIVQLGLASRLRDVRALSHDRTCLVVAYRPSRQDLPFRFVWSILMAMIVD